MLKRKTRILFKVYSSSHLDCALDLEDSHCCCAQQEQQLERKTNIVRRGRVDIYVYWGGRVPAGIWTTPWQGNLSTQKPRVINVWTNMLVSIKQASLRIERYIRVQGSKSGGHWIIAPIHCKECIDPIPTKLLASIASYNSLMRWKQMGNVDIHNHKHSRGLDQTNLNSDNMRLNQQDHIHVAYYQLHVYLHILHMISTNSSGA